MKRSALIPLVLSLGGWLAVQAGERNPFDALRSARVRAGACGGIETLRVGVPGRGVARVTADGTYELEGLTVGVPLRVYESAACGGSLVSSRAVQLEPANGYTEVLDVTLPATGASPIFGLDLTGSGGMRTLVIPLLGGRAPLVLRGETADGNPYPGGPLSSEAVKLESTHPGVATIAATAEVTAVSPGLAWLRLSGDGEWAQALLHVDLTFDTDKDGMPDSYEVSKGFDPLIAADGLGDADADGLKNVEEYRRGTDPRNNDSDEDLLFDGDELVAGTDPLNGDTDGDTALDGSETRVGVDPLNSNEKPGVSFTPVFRSSENLSQVGLRGALTSDDTFFVLTNDGRLTSYGIDLVNFFLIFRDVEPISADVRDIAIEGTTAYVAAGAAGLVLVNVSNPAVITKTATIGGLGSVQGVRVQGGVVYLATDAGLRILRPGAGGALEAVGFLPLPVFTRLAVSGSTAYLGVPSLGRVVSVDVTNPASPVELQRFLLPASVSGFRALEVSGPFLYVAHGAAGLFAVSTADPRALQVIDSAAPELPGASFDAVTLHGNRLYAHTASLNTRVQIFRVFEDGSIGLVGEVINNSAGATQVLANQHYLVGLSATSFAVSQILERSDRLSNAPTGTLLVDGGVTDLTPGAVTGVFARLRDDIYLENVQFFVDGQFVLQDAFPPFRLSYRAPLSRPAPYVVSISALATDLRKNQATFGGIVLVVREDLDGDLIPDNLDDDQDGDGASNLEEIYPGSDGYVSDPRVVDTDGDGIQDGEESRPGVDGYVTNAGSVDTDLDRLPDPYEIVVTLTHPARFDTDGNGISDGDEDIDADGLSNRDEFRYGSNPRNPDTDGDGLPDGLEVALGLDPTRTDTDGDGIADGDEDFDGDTLENRREVLAGTNPLKADSDDDGFDDAAEILLATNPIVATDFSTMAVAFTGRNVTLRGPVTVAALTLTNSLLTSPQASGRQVVPLDLTVTGTLTVNVGSRIDVSGKGCAGGRGPGNSSHLGLAPTGIALGGELAGGSHGGLGGFQGGVFGEAVQPGYDSFDAPALAGGGGSAMATGNARGGSGGGILRVAAARIVVNGVIAANGEGAPAVSGAGGGAGGAVVLRCGTLEGTGSIEADGGAAPQVGSQPGGGGGGRIAVHVTGANSMDLTRITARGGGLMPGPEKLTSTGGAGTVFLVLGAAAGDGHLVVDAGGREVALPRTLLAGSANDEVRLDRLTVRAKGRLLTSAKLRLGAETSPLLLDDGEIDAHAIRFAAASIVQIGAGRLILDDLEALAGRLAILGFSGCHAAIGSALDAENLRLNASRLEVGGEIRAETLELVAAILSVLDPDAAGYTPLDLEIGDTVTVDAASRIDLVGKGFVGGYQGGSTNVSGQTSSGFSGEARSGGGHAASGGLSETGVDNGQGVHGALDEANLPGGGGAAEFAALPSQAAHRGGNGGGVLRLIAGTLVLEGSIDVSGVGAERPELFTSDRAGAGAGGSVRLEVGAIRGAGRIVAAGGAARGTALSHGGAGGGGRIAFLYVDRGLFTGTLEAPGGTLIPGPATLRSVGGAGTIFEQAQGTGTGTLTIDAGNRTPRGELTVLAGTSTLFLQRFVVRGGARVRSERTIAIASLDLGAPDRWTLRGVLRGPRLELPTTPILDIDGGELDQSMIVAAAPGLGTVQARNGGTLRLSSPFTATAVSLTGSSRITVREPTSLGTFAADVTLTGELNIETGSSIDVAAMGYVGGGRGGNTSRLGQSADHAVVVVGGRTGGSHAALGGFQGVGSGLGVTTAPVFDDFVLPARPGGGGSARTTDPVELGYNGGGLVRIKAQSLVVNGRIDAQGDGRQRAGNTDLGGAGAGGGIAIEVETLSGAGQIIAEGGSADGGVGAGGGGGGRIAIRYSNRAGFTGTVQAFGGTLVPFVSKSSSVGGAGTIYWKSPAQGFGDLIVDAGNRGQSTLRTQIRAVGSGTITSLTATLLGATASTFPVSDTGLRNQWVVVNNRTLTPFRIASNSALSLTTDASTGNMTTAGVVGNPFLGAIVLDNLLVTNQAAMTTNGELVIITTGAATVNNSASLASPPVVRW